MKKEILLVKANFFKAGDVENFLCIQKSVANDVTYKMGSITIKGALVRFQRSHILFIKEYENIVGVIEYQIKVDHVYIQGLAVHTEHQGRGIGRQALTLFLEDNFKEAQRVELSTHPCNVNALALYLSLGFEIETEDADTVRLSFTRK